MYYIRLYNTLHQMYNPILGYLGLQQQLSDRREDAGVFNGLPYPAGPTDGAALSLQPRVAGGHRHVSHPPAAVQRTAAHERYRRITISHLHYPHNTCITTTTPALPPPPQHLHYHHNTCMTTTTPALPPPPQHLHDHHNLLT